jgi:hypothetical protein
MERNIDVFLKESVGNHVLLVHASIGMKDWCKKIPHF